MKEQEILSLINERLGIRDLNDLQKSVLKNLKISSSAIIYSPTGSGKTLAFSVTLLKALKNFDTEKLQAVIIAPSRELVIQISDVIRPIAPDYKVTCFMVAIMWLMRKIHCKMCQALLLALQADCLTTPTEKTLT